jgi:phosphate transport system permease protein
MSIRASAPPNYARRKLADRLARGFMLVATTIAVVPLLLIIGYVLYIGGSALSADFFTQSYLPPAFGDAAQPSAAPLAEVAVPTAGPTEAVVPGATPDPFAGIGIDSAPGTGAQGQVGGAAAQATPDPFANLDPTTAGVEGLAGAEAVPVAADASQGINDLTQIEARGGVLHGIIGTLMVAGLALLLAVPIGLLAGIFLAEYPGNAVATFVRFCTDVLSGAPSIIVGVTIYVLIVRQTQTYSGYAGAVALAMLMVPTITRTTEEVLKLVPDTVREAAMALGAPTWWSTFTVVVPTALSGVVTGALLAFARGAGETAPLLLTIQGASRVSLDMAGPMAALPLLIYRYTESPFPSENKLAWGAAFVITSLVLIVNIVARLAIARQTRRG